MDEEKPLVRIRIGLPEDDPWKAETVWALPLGGSLYELRNSPWFAYDLSWGDVVACLAVEGDLPRVRRVVRRSGHRTLRVVFGDKTPELSRREVLTILDEMAANHEHASGSLYAIDVRPEADYQAVCDFLWKLEQEGVLTYETGATSRETFDPGTLEG